MVLNAAVEDDEAVDQVPEDELLGGEADDAELETTTDELEDEAPEGPALGDETEVEEELEAPAAAWTPPSREVYEQLQQQAAQTQQLTQLLAIEQTERQRFQQDQAQRQYMAQQQQAAQYQAQQQQAAQQAAQFQWNAPQWDPANEQYLTYNAAGQVVAAAHCPDPRLPAQYQAFQRHQQDFVRNLATNPMQALAPVLDHHARQLIAHVEQRFEQRLQAQQAEQARTQAALGFVEGNRDWMIQHDAQGRPVRNPQNGEFMFSPQGQFAAEETQRLMQYGVPLAEATKYAHRLTDREVLKAHVMQADAGQSAAAINAAQKKNLQRGAVRQTARTGGQPKPGQPAPHRKQSLKDILRGEGVYELPDEAFEPDA